MTNQQLYFAIGIPMLFNAGLIGILLAYINARFTTVERSMEQRFIGVDQRFASIGQRFASLEQSIDQRFVGMDQRFASLEQSIDRRFSALDQRLDDLRDVWRAELHRVEEVLDARLKHLEDR